MNDKKKGKPLNRNDLKIEEKKTFSVLNEF